MRPVTKASIGTLLTLADGTQQSVAGTYNPYQDAKPALVANLGRFCSYCEEAYHYDRDIHVEHVQPKGLPRYAHLEFDWTNFLLDVQHVMEKITRERRMWCWQMCIYLI